MLRDATADCSLCIHLCTRPVRPGRRDPVVNPVKLAETKKKNLTSGLGMADTHPDWVSQHAEPIVGQELTGITGTAGTAGIAALEGLRGETGCTLKLCTLMN